ncbi:MAG: hypothetical protein ACRDB9_06495 [Cetobacterium sp.]
MEELITQLSGLGVIGIVGGLFLKKYLQESAEDRKIQQEERMQDRALYKQSVENFTSVSKQYVESISKVTIRVENLEENTEKLKDSTERIEDKIDLMLHKVGE